MGAMATALSGHARTQPYAHADMLAQVPAWAWHAGNKIGTQ
jgi:hypothetical protein